MNPSPQRAGLASHELPAGPQGAAFSESSQAEGGFDPVQWRESAAEQEITGAGGRLVLGVSLSFLALAWVSLVAWSAGTTLGRADLSAAVVAQWLAIAAGPLALLGLVWLMFGRTRRREAEQFTRTVVAMRTEARSLEAVLRVLGSRIGDSEQELSSVARRLMELGDETSSRITAVTQELGRSSSELVRNGEALDRAAESARNDIGVLIDDLPRAEQHAEAMAEALRGAGLAAAQNSEVLRERLAALGAASDDAEQRISAGAERLEQRADAIEKAGRSAAEQVSEAAALLSASVDALLERTVSTLDTIRGGIDVQSNAVTALVEQANSGIAQVGSDAADAVHTSVAGANAALDGLAARIAEHEGASERVLTQTTEALGRLDREFAALAEQGDLRAGVIAEAIGRARDLLAQLGADAGTQARSVDELAERTEEIRRSIDSVAAAIRDELAAALDGAQAGATRLTQSAGAVRPELEWMRDAAVEASDRISASAATIAAQQDQLAGLLGTIDDKIDGAQDRLRDLAQSIANAEEEARLLGGETGPALVDAMVQVREAAAHAATRAKEAIASVIPEGAEQFSQATRDALETVFRETIQQRLLEVDAAAEKAVDAARAATERLSGQMLSLGQTAAALQQHIEETSAAERERDSEAFARRVSLLIDSMHSAAIDVGKILSDEVDDRAWDAYLKGDRAVFTRRAARLLDGAEVKGLRTHYESDLEFQRSANRYVHDFESMLRRVMAERDGGAMAVTLMSSDMGKLYAALAQVVERRR